MDTMTPSRPYLVRAIYEWVVDNNCTPYLLANSNYPKARVPLEYVREGKIILNVSPSAVRHLHIDNEFVQFSARFGGKSQEVYLPIGAVLAVYAKENGRGMFFDADELPPPPQDDDTTPDPDPKPPTGGNRPALKVVK